MFVCVWVSSGSADGSKAVAQPSTGDRLAAVACRADIPHLPLAEFLNSIINYFSIFTLNTTQYGLYLLYKNNHKPNLTGQSCPRNVYRIYGLYNRCRHSIDL